MDLTRRLGMEIIQTILMIPLICLLVVQATNTFHDICPNKFPGLRCQEFPKTSYINEPLWNCKNITTGAEILVNAVDCTVTKSNCQRLGGESCTDSSDCCDPNSSCEIHEYRNNTPWKRCQCKLTFNLHETGYFGIKLCVANITNTKDPCDNKDNCISFDKGYECSNTTSRCSCEIGYILVSEDPGKCRPLKKINDSCEFDRQCEGEGELQSIFCNKSCIKDLTGICSWKFVDSTTLNPGSTEKLGLLGILGWVGFSGLLVAVILACTGFWIYKRLLLNPGAPARQENIVPQPHMQPFLNIDPLEEN